MTAATKKTVAAPTLEERVAVLEDATRKLARSQDSLRRGQRATNQHVRDLEKLVRELPAQTGTQLANQTRDLEVIVAQSETRTADRVTSVARQVPTWAVIAITVLAGLVANIFCAAMRWPHIG